MNLSLKRNGLLVRYLSFCYADSNFLPRSFCTLFWLLLLSILALPFCWGFLGLSKIIDWVITQQKLSLRMAGVKLAAEYRINPDLAFCDWYQHLGNNNYRGSFRNPNHRIVVAAFEILSIEFNCSWFMVLDRLAPTIEYDGLANYAKSMSLAYTPIKAKSLIDFSWISNYSLATFQWTCSIAILLPLFVFGINTYLFCLCMSGIGLLLFNLFDRAGVYKLAYNFYHMVKDKTCPIIVWE